jgi:hypothetical protein
MVLYIRRERFVLAAFVKYIKKYIYTERMRDGAGGTEMWAMWQLNSRYSAQVPTIYGAE